MRRMKTTAYSVARRTRTSLFWELLQRPHRAEDKTGFPKGWELLVRKGIMPPALRDALLTIAAEWRDEYLEFEGNPDWISAYWEEHGGKPVADRIAKYLKDLEAACSGDAAATTPPVSGGSTGTRGAGGPR
jgi:hypothetical protein